MIEKLPPHTEWDGNSWYSVTYGDSSMMAEYIIESMMCMNKRDLYIQMNNKK